MAGVSILSFLKTLFSGGFVPALEAGSGILAVALFGFFTSFHCIGMCGGTVLAQCAEGEPVRQSILFNLGRVVTCTAVGGVLGALGSVITLNPWLKGLLPLTCAVFLLLSGLRLLGLPGPRILSLQQAKRTQYRRRGAFLMGILTGLLPCGMLQTVQVYALGTGSPLTGAVSMFAFALTSSPVLAAFGILAGLLNLRGQKLVRILSAVVILYMGLGMLLKALGWMEVSV